MHVQAKMLPYVPTQNFSMVITADGAVTLPASGTVPTPISPVLLQKCRGKLATASRRGLKHATLAYHFETSRTAPLLTIYIATSVSLFVTSEMTPIHPPSHLQAAALSTTLIHG